jgi:hypothetical protein
MKYTLTILLSCIFIPKLQAQFLDLGEGRFEGKNISQTDLNLLFINYPNLAWLDFDYKDSVLLLPDFKKLEVLAIKSEVLARIVFPDTLASLSLIDFHLPQLSTIDEPNAEVPKLFQLTLYAKLNNLPNFICTAPELRLVDIKNYKDIMWPDCMEARFVNGPFELSSCEILDSKDGNTISKIVSPDNVKDEWLEASDDMSPEELEEFMKYEDIGKSARRIGLLRRASGILLAGVVFLIWAN